MHFQIDQIDREMAFAGVSPMPQPLPQQQPSTINSIPSRLSQMTNPSTSFSSITEKIKLVKLQRDTLALELEVLKLRKTTPDNAVSKEAISGGKSTKSRMTRKKRAIYWTREFSPGVPINEFEKLELPNFVASFFYLWSKHMTPSTRRLCSESQTFDDKGFKLFVAQAFGVFPLTSPDKSSYFTWNLALIHNNVTIFVKHSDLQSSIPQQCSSTSVGGRSPLGSSETTNRC